jgi:hypothetical protein
MPNITPYATVRHEIAQAMVSFPIGLHSCTSVSKLTSPFSY